MTETNTKRTLEPAVIEHLQALIRLNFDNGYCLRDAAEQISDSALALAFGELSDVRIDQATELRELVAINAQTPAESGTLAGAAHVAWLNLRSAASGGDAYVVSAEATKAEERLRDRYQQALVATAGSAVNEILLRHFAAVKSACDRLVAMRDQRAP